MSEVVLSPNPIYATAFHVDHWAALSLVIPNINKTVATIAGRIARGDGGGGHFYWDSDSTATDDGGTILNPGLGSGAGRWRRIYTPGKLEAAWFGVSSGNSASVNSTGFAAAIAAIQAQGGGTLLLPNGLIQHSTPLVFDTLVGVTLQGASSFYGPTGANHSTILQYTGSVPVSISCLSTIGMAFRDLQFEPLSTYAGKLVAFGHSLSGGDCVGVVFDSCTLLGNWAQGITPATIGIDLTFVLNSSIHRCSFENLDGSICGGTFGGYSYSAIISDCFFAAAPIRDPGSSWCIENNTVEGLGSWTGGYFIDGANPGELIVRNCFSGDSGAITMVRLTGSLDGLFEANTFGAGVLAFDIGGTGNVFRRNNGLTVSFQSGTTWTTLADNQGLQVTNPANAGIGVNGSQFHVTMTGNVGGGGYIPPTIIGGQSSVVVPQGLTVRDDGTPIGTHFSVLAAGFTWTGLVGGAIPNGQVAHTGLVQVGPTAGITPATTTLYASLDDPNAPPGVFVTANVSQASTFVQISILNMSGSPYIPPASIHVDAWVH